MPWKAPVQVMQQNEHPTGPSKAIYNFSNYAHVDKYRQFPVSQKAVFGSLAMALSLKHNPTTLSFFPDISSQN